MNRSQSRWETLRAFGLFRRTGGTSRASVCRASPMSRFRSARISIGSGCSSPTGCRPIDAPLQAVP